MTNLDECGGGGNISRRQELTQKGFNSSVHFAIQKGNTERKHMCAANNAQWKPSQIRLLSSVAHWPCHTPLLKTLNVFHCLPSRNQIPHTVSICMTPYNPPLTPSIWLFHCSLYYVLTSEPSSEHAFSPSYCPPLLPHYSVLGNSYLYFRAQYILCPPESIPHCPRRVTSACISLI